MSLIRALPALVLIAPLLGGCLTTTSPEQVAQQNDETCAKRGHKPGSTAFTDCVSSLEAQRERRMDSRRQEMLERSNMPAAATRN